METNDSTFQHSKSRMIKVSGKNKDHIRIGLVRYSKILGRDTTITELSDGFSLEDGILPLDYVPRSMKRIGLSAQVVNIEVEDLKDYLLPALIIGKSGKSLILMNWSGNKAEIIIPESGGKDFVDLSKLKDQYSGKSILAKPIYQKDDRAGDFAKPKKEHWFKGPLKNCWPSYLEVAIASFVANMLSIAASIFTLQVYDRVVPNSAFDTLFVLSIGVILAIIFDFLIRSLRSYLLDSTGKKLDIRISSELFSRAMQIRLSSKPSSTGAFSSQLREFETVRDFFTSSTASTISDLPFTIIFLMIIAYLGNSVVWVPIISIVFMLLPSLLMQFKLARLARSNLRESAVKNGLMLEVIDNLETIKTTRAEGKKLKLWEELTAQLSEDSIKIRQVSSLLTLGASMIHQLCYVGVVIVGVFEISNGNLTIGGLIACTMLTSRTVAPINQMTGILVRWQHVKVALEGLDELMNAPVERPEGRKFAQKARLKGDFKIDTLKYKYDQDSPAALVINKLSIDSGSRLILLGKNGSGKSTLLRLLSGLSDPNEGQILLDHLNINQIDPIDRCRSVGYLPQDVSLFYGTLRENLTLDGESYTDEVIYEALDAVGLGTAVRGHSLGLDMPITSNHSVSGGQRQAIGLARLLLQDPSIVLMDEPTASLDQDSEEKVIKYLNTWLKGRTLIMSTHKKRMLVLGQRGIVLHKGSIVMDGSLEKILSNYTK